MEQTTDRTTARIVSRIARLKTEHRAVIIAHNYQVGEIQDVADFVGDSLELSQKAAATDAAVIVFCGVHFMAETAAVLCPDQTVLLPDLSAGCGMSEMIAAADVRAMKAAHPGAVVVCYVNSSAEVKAESDICCTSSNAVAVVQSIPPTREVIFIPDQHLGDYVMRQTGRELILYNGYCPTHVRMLTDELSMIKADHPTAIVLAHPECPSDTRDLADGVFSTSGICATARTTEHPEVIVATESGIVHRLRKESPDKTFIPACTWCDCAHMKVNTLEKILWSLEAMAHVVRVEPAVAHRARRAIDRMMAIGR